MEFVLTNYSCTNAFVTLDGQDLLAISTSTSVLFHLVKMEANVLIALTISLAYAKLDTQARDVSIPLTTAHQTHAKTEQLVLTKSMASSANVAQVLLVCNVRALSMNV